MLKIGLTGGIASGKSTVSDILKNFGVPIFDADLAVRELSQPGTASFNAIKRLLGPNVIKDEGELDRQKIRDIIFSDDAKRKTIEAILHPAVRQWLLDKTNEIENQTVPYCVLVVPLLIEASMTDLVDIITVIDCDEARQIERLAARDRYDEAQARQILLKQMNRLQRLTEADFVIENNDSVEKLEKRILNLHNTWKQIAAR